MRFLLLTQYYPPEIGAPQVRLRAMVAELVRHGHQLEVVTMMPNYPEGEIRPAYRGRLYSEESIDGVLVRRVWGYPSTGRGFARALNYLSFSAMSLFGLMLAAPADFLFVESPPITLSLPACLCAWLRGTRIIFNVADLWPDSLQELGFMGEGLLLSLLRIFERLAYRSSRYVNAVTIGLRKRLLDIKRVPASKVLFLPNGVNTSIMRPLPYDHALARSLGVSTEKVIVYAGTHGYVHRLDVALEAARLLRGSGVMFLFIGDGSDKERLMKSAENMKLDNVIFLDSLPVERISSYYSIAMAGLSTISSSPLFENTRPVKVFSIMACGKPVIYSGRGEGAEIVASSGAGLVVPPEDPVALSEAIRQLVGNRRLAVTMGKRGRVYAERHLSWENIVGEWLSQLRQGGANQRRQTGRSHFKNGIMT